ncbi:serpin B6 isoform X2 [Anabrus simplex]|uniref:serpin B6 isoform X2 n=1 Tax=Anabrus simplex TaxID=316456 RepID=UPI0035A2F23E
MAVYQWTVALVCTLVATVVTSETSENEAAVVRGNNDFGMRWYQIQARNPGNIFLSPISAEFILGLLSMGAEGTTLSEMAQVLNLPEDKDVIASGFQSLMQTILKAGEENVTLDIANRIYIDSTFVISEGYKRIAEGPFLSDIISTDFTNNPDESRISINQWVEEKTNDRIKDLLSSDAIRSDTRTVLVNAIYFKGNWTKKFNSKNTRSQKFYKSCNEVLTVEMMQTTDSYMMAEFADFQAIQMDYQGNELHMLILLPRDCDDGSKLENLAQSVNLTNIYDSMRSTKVEVYIPKFRIEQTIEMTDDLEEMGMRQMFTDSADFSGISTTEPVKVSTVIQKTFVEVSEEGTEAAAATGGVTVLSLPPRFRADRPFLFMIKQAASGPILFIGKYEGK